MILAIEIITSILTIMTFWLMGNKWKYAPIAGILAQIFWIAFVIMTRSWGLGIAAVFILYIHIINLIKWTRRNK